MQILFKLQHDKDIEEINLLTEEIEQESRKIRLEIDAMKNQSTKLVEANNIKALAQARA